MLDKDVCHVNIFPKLKVVQIAFGSFFGVSPKDPATCFVVSFPYQFFNINFFFRHNPQVGFWETPRPRFFQLPKGCFRVPIDFFPISCGGINFISIEVIIPATYLVNWVFIAPIINIKFLFNCRLFSLEMIGINSFDLLML